MAEITAQDDFEVRFIRTPEQYAIGVRVRAEDGTWSAQAMLTAGQVDQFIDELATARDKSRRASMRELAQAAGADDEELEELLDEALPLDEDEP
ncbi:hypothetical protein ACFQH3_08885 [Haladaptatus sp. GCM10025707]|uniref:hypothetical protein n=1 Tax=unclassified Haladaptatus TaxID=2622732 RepID=UPI0023E87A59|nr:hypothetical protein [Haladaptatus sp. QDMS2]